MDITLTIVIGSFCAVLLWIVAAWQKKIERAEKSKIAEEIREARETGSHKAIGQYPQINPYLCVGCGSCVAACPEDGVLGLVNGIAHIIHGSRCVGHARCQDACPVQAIKVGLGDVSNRPDIPLLTESLETTVSGIFIAGELGGIALIRHAIGQGVRAVATISERLKKTQSVPQKDVLDILIIGAGPAGLSATLKAKDLGLSTLTISQDDVGGTILKYPRRKLTLVQSVEVPLYGKLKEREYEKEELLALWESLIQKNHLALQLQTKLESITKVDSLFETKTSSGVFKSRTVILALGRRGTPRKLEVPGEDSKKVFYQLIDTAGYSHQHILVVGGGDSAVEAAMGLANQQGNTVILSYRKPAFVRLKSRNAERIKKYVDQGKVKLFLSSRVIRIEPTTVTLELDFETADKKTVRNFPNEHVFIFAGGDPPFPLLKSIGIGFSGQA